MNNVLPVLLAWYCFIAFVSSFYFWLKKTDRSQAPIVRRLTAAGYGLIWPVMIVKFISMRNQNANEEAERRAMEDRILRNAPPTTAPGSPNPGGRAQSGPAIRNPFDDQ